MTTKYEDIVKALPALTTHELVQIRSRINLRLAGAVTTDSPGESSYSIEGILCLRAREYVDIPHIDTIKARNPMQLGSKLENTVLQLVDLSAKLNLGPKETAKLAVVTVDCANSKLEHLNVGKTFKALLSAMDNVKLLLDDSFPGYMKAGLLTRMVLASVVLPSDSLTKKP